MNVADLRRILDELPGDMPILTYDEGTLDGEFSGATVHQCAPLPGEQMLRIIEPNSAHPDGTQGKRYLIIF